MNKTCVAALVFVLGLPGFARAEDPITGICKNIIQDLYDQTPATQFGDIVKFAESVLDTVPRFGAITKTTTFNSGNPNRLEKIMTAEAFSVTDAQNDMVTCKNDMTSLTRLRNDYCALPNHHGRVYNAYWSFYTPGRALGFNFSSQANGLVCP